MMPQEADSEVSRTVNTSPQPGFGRVATIGLIWMLLQTAVAKSMAFVAQLVLGWILAKDDYALYALAISVSALIGAMRNGGLQKILIQRGSEFEHWAGAVLQISLAFNLLCAVVLLVAAPVAAAFYSAPALPPLLWVTAGAIVMSTPAMVFQARVLSRLQFATSARISSMSSVVFYGSMIVFAIVGLGPLSFVLPQIAIAVFDTVAYGLAGKGLPRLELINGKQLRDLLGSSGWVMASALAVTLVNQGDLLVVGRLQPEVLGVYFFGVTLAAAFATVFGAGLSSVLMPTLTRLAGDNERFGRAYVHTIRHFVLLFAPVCVVAAAFASPLVSLLWNGKWNESIFVVEAITLSLLFRMQTPIALAALEAQAQWRTIALLLFIDGLGTLTAATIGCLIGGVHAVVICVCISRVVMAVMQCVAVGHWSGAGPVQVLLAMVPSAGVAVASALISGGLTAAARQWFHLGDQMMSSIFFVAAFVLCYAGVCRLLIPRRAAEAMSIIRSLRKQRPSVDRS